MAKIDTFLSNILSSIYGKDVRQAIHDSISEINNESTGTKAYVNAFIKQVEQGVIGVKVALDTTLTQSGKAADAKVVGDALTTLEGKITESGGSGGNGTTINWGYIEEGEIFELSTEEEPVVPVPCTGITLNKTKLTLNDTETGVTLAAAVTPFDTTDQIVWSVDNSGVATVENGVVKAIANGSCVITVTCGTYSATCSVTVNIIASYTKSNLDGYFDFVGVEDGYSGVITNRAENGTLQGETHYFKNGTPSQPNHYGGIVNGEMLTGSSESFGGVGHYDGFVVTVPDTGGFYTSYPFSVECYGMMAGGWSGAGVRSESVGFNINRLDLATIMTTRFKTTDNPANGGSNTGTTVGYSDASTLRSSGATGSGYNIFALDSAVDLTAYHHYVVVVDSALVRVYLDGVKVGEGTAGNNTSIGANPLFVLGSGNLKMCRVYKAILTDEQVANNYTNTIDMYGGDA